MALDLLLLTAGLALVLGGAEGLVRGGSGLARDFGISPLLIGLTVVAFGTSTPELAVNVAASWSHRGALAFGNIMGSNIANIGLVIGAAALFRPIPVEGTIIRREVPIMLLASAAALTLGLYWPGDSDAGFDRRDGVMLLLLFCIFLYTTAIGVFRQRGADPFVVQAHLATPSRMRESVLLNVVMTLAGLVALVAGADLTVRAAVGLATAFGVPSVVIGLTIVALGTSLPELATALVAIRREQTDLAVGTIVGSNIFNLLFVGGLSAVIGGLPLPAGGNIDLAVMSLLSILLLVVCSTHERRIIRSEAVLLLSIYLAFIIVRTALSVGATL